ncbi:hypothetical protein [Thermococcus sp.]|nr:hypothetical protein [Thermococcus sp.]
MRWGRLFRGLVRVHIGFSIVRINSLGIRYPKKTSGDLLDTAITKLKKGI